MRASICQSSLSSFLKFLNYLQSFAGAFIILYSLWMLSDWNHHRVDKSSAPWFVYTVLSFGVLLCLIAFTGYIAAGAANGCCLCSYAVFTSAMILVEAALMGDLVFNKHWEQDLPHDATGNLQSLRAFIEANMDLFKWIAVTVVVVQAISLLLAIILRGIVPRDDEKDDEFTYIRNPLLNPQDRLASALTTVENPTTQADSWSSRMRQKYGLVPSAPPNGTYQQEQQR